MPLIIQDCYLIHRTLRIEISDLVAYQEIDGIFWNATVMIVHGADFWRVAIDDILILHIQGITAHLHLKSKHYSDNGGSPQFIFELQSPQPELRINRLFDMDISAQSACQELLGIQPADWHIHDWIIPRNTLIATGNTAVEIASQIAAAVGGVILSKLDGGFRAIYRAAIPANFKNLSARDDILSFSERVGTGEYFNAILIANAPDTPPTYSMSFDSESQELRIESFPFINDLRIECTGDNRITIGAMVVRYEDIEETIEIKAGKGSVQHNIVQINNFDWHDRNLGQIFFKGQEITAQSEGYSILRISYRYCYIAFKIHSNGAPIKLTQFLLWATEPVRGVRIICERGKGDILRGEDLINPLISDLETAKVCGRGMIEWAGLRRDINMDCVPQAIDCGQWVKLRTRFAKPIDGVVVRTQYGLKPNGNLVLQLQVAGK